ncbi:hypothetical protein [Coralloluteibacterium thermophilus]|uniref:Uncharacterized protein n=1 Tax=Coralloluteibacterium thermophilum TaxID=2707049 RepID=A0ABV9NNM9_9GAMM
MADTAYTHSNNSFAICVEPQNSNLDAAAFAALEYVEVAGIGNVGERGISTNIVNYDTWNSLVISKGKGLTDAGNAEVEMLRVPTDPGQVAMRTAGAPTNKNNYAFRETLQDGTFRYYRALVSGPRHPGGRNEDFDLDVYTLGLNQATLDVPPTP